MPTVQPTATTDRDENVAKVAVRGNIYNNESFPILKNGYWPSISAGSGGTQLQSLDCGLVVIKNLSGNSDMFVGGIDTDAPFSGHGYLLSPGQNERFYVNNAAALCVCSSVSGELISWIGYSNGINVTMDSTTQGERPLIIDVVLSGWTPVSGSTDLTSGGNGLTIIATFDNTLKASTVSISSFILRRAGSSFNISGVVTACGENAIFVVSSGAMAAADNAPSTSAQFVPIIIGDGNVGGMEDIGDSFVSTTSGSYFTETSMSLTDVSPPVGAVHVLSGLNMTPLRIFAQFDRLLLSGTVNVSSFVVRASGSSTNLSGTVEVSGPTTTFIMASGIITTTSAQYHPIFIGSGNAVGMKDLAGNFIANTTGQFITLNSMTLSGWVPVSGATHVFSGTGSPSLHILAQFDRLLLSGTVNISSFIFRAAGSATNLSGTVEVSGSNCTFVVASGVVTNTSSFYHPIILGSGNAVGIQDLHGTFASTASGAFITMTEPII